MGRTRSQHTKPDIGVGLILTDEELAFFSQDIKTNILSKANLEVDSGNMDTKC
ncbi:hypothetical protein K1B48_04655 [Lactobacillus johnsonii]|uniref:hypothetical protein n=1 Tax=Lactobacillus johnsonii TaxID=33959 RepID=UPI001C68B00A|nr:hypothetical protein [Lactobacillus johnsonii]MBW8460470.1 hypothetical protein [Lactobacillus johnsonii]